MTIRKKPPTGEELRWAKEAMNKQGDLVFGVIKGLSGSFDKHIVLKTLNKQGRDLEPHHVAAALKNLKERGLLLQKAGGMFEIKVTK